MSYWGSHFTSLRDQKEEDDMDEESDPDKELRESLSLTKEQFDEAKECFRLVDTSGRGKLTAAELKAVLRSAGEDPDEEDIRDIIYEIDRDSDGEVDFIDFLHVMHKTLKKPISDEVIETCFQTLDGEENQFITMRGLERIFVSLGQKRTDDELKEMVAFIDTGDEEGLIKFEDFKKYLEKENLLRSKVEDEKKMDDDEALITETRKRK